MNAKERPTIWLSCFGGSNKRQQFAVLMAFVLGLVVSLPACNRTDWNWDLDWWRAQDRRVEPTDRQVTDAGEDDKNTATASRANGRTPSAVRSTSTGRSGGDGSRRAGTGS